MEKDKVQEDIQVEKEAEIEEEEEAAGIEEEGRKRERKSGEGEGGSPTRKKRDPAATERKRQLVAEWHKNLMEETLKEMARFPEEDWSDRLAMEAREFRENWEFSWSPFFGPFEKTTPIPPVRFTNCTPVPGHASLHDSLQIFSVRIKELRRGLQWPIHVFGLIAARDTIDQNRIIVFNHTRDNCQTLTKEDRYLSLTGPTRAVVATDNVHLEAVLKVKGSIESEDKDLSFLTVSLIRTFQTVKTCLVNREYTSRLSTMELTFGYVVHSLEAAISVHVIDGLWQDGYRGLFAAHTFSLKDSKVVLLDCGYDEMVPVNADGRIGLSRHVVSVESKGDLTVSVMAFGCDDVKEDAKDFTPKDAGMSCDVLDVGFCKMEVTVAWSLISLVPHEYIAQCHSGGV